MSFSRFPNDITKKKPWTMIIRVMIFQKFPKDKKGTAEVTPRLRSGQAPK
jgi:hypothetical protein